MSTAQYGLETLAGDVAAVKSSSKPEELLRMNGSIHEERTTSEPQDRVTELIEQQTAISEVLHAIANSPHDLQPIFDAILDSATRLCRADAGSLRLSEESGLRRVAMRGDPLFIGRALSSVPVLAEKGGCLGRLATSRLPTHIPDMPALKGDPRDDFWITAAANTGLRTVLVVPLLNDNEIVGIISLSRKQVQPFTDRQTSLFRDFAAQATIALESTRRERQYREMQSELAHANRVATMGQLTASIAHETKQPITAARTYAAAALRFLDKSPPDVAEVRGALTCIVDQTARACDVVDRTGSLIKKAPPRKEVVDLNAAILEVTALTRSEAIKTGVTMGTQLADELPRIQCDRVQLQQVMLNLILNAIQSMSGVEDGNRELHISTVSIEPEGMCVSVRDTGHGLRPESLPRLFEPFYTTKPDGMGMGLSICRSIIEAHGGRLWATGCEPRGALFQFTIPAD
ncbi:signal transduction histidine kinase [Bradyrhizobium sp. AZCC 2262]|uniref:sensor histidine kinase n=1 Tax=Bradyrhizobium sp. AZCC 2262 TaxID=3117022 RepID=UPI002FEF95F0